MQTIELISKIKSFKGNDPSEEYRDAENYLSIQIADVVDKYDKNGDLTKTLFLNIKKDRALVDVMGANSEIEDAIVGIHKDEAIEIVEIMTRNCKAKFQRQIFAKGEKNTLENRVFDKNTIVNTIVEVETKILGENAKETIRELREKGKKHLAEEKAAKESEKAARRQLIAAKIAASEAAENAALLATEVAATPTPAPAPTLDEVPSDTNE